MIRYLSEEWFAAADEALRTDTSIGRAFGDTRFVLEQVVTGAVGGDIAYSIEVQPGAVSVHAGSTGSPTVTFTVDLDTAIGIARGTANAQEGFTSGRLHFSGDVGILLRHHEALAALDDVLADLRSRTDFDVG